LNSENCIVVDKRISPGNRTQSRRYPVTARQQSCPRQGERAGHHRGLRAGHVDKWVIRELGRASRLLGNNRRSKGDRRNQHPGVWWPTRPAGEPTPAFTGRNTKRSASTQGTGREPKADRPGRTKAVVATHSTAGQWETADRTRGEPRPKGPTITLAGAREGNAGHDVSAKERQEGTLSPQTVLTKLARIAQEPGRRGLRFGWAATVMTPCGVVNCKVLGPRGPLLTNRMSELFTYGSVGGVGSNPGSYPAPNSRPSSQLQASLEVQSADSLRTPSSGGCR